MFIDYVKKEYFGLIAELEQRVYPEELVLGIDELRKADHGSLCGFEKGELVCYILLERKPFGKEVYISDLVSTSSKYLKPLLITAFRLFEDIKISAHLRNNSYQILKKLETRYPDAVSILEDIKYPEYYPNGESANEVVFTIDLESILNGDWKGKLLRHLYTDFLYKSPMDVKTIFEDMMFEAIEMGVDLYDERNKNFVIKKISETILDYYQLYDENIKGTIHTYLNCKRGIGSGNTIKKAIRTLIERGYEENQMPSDKHFFQYGNSLVLNSVIEIRNTAHPGKLSGYRWLCKKEMKFEAGMKNGGYMTYYNKYGVQHPMLPVPYLTDRNYFYWVRQYEYVLDLCKRFEICAEADKVCIKRSIRRTWKMLPHSTAYQCMEHIAKNATLNISQYFHDWDMVVTTLYENREILTQGAVSAILMKSYNEARRICDHINAIRNTVLIDKKLEKAFGIKEIRKRLSSLLRKGQDCSIYVNELSEAALLWYSRHIQIPEKEAGEIYDFIERMKKYCNFVTLQNLYFYFGKKCMKQFVKGTYPCVFEKAIITPSYDALVDLTKQTLKIKSRKAKHIYTGLKRNGLLDAVLEGDLPLDHAKKVIEILKYHNAADVEQRIGKLLNFRATIEQKGAPEFLVAGDASVCCMGYGTRKAVAYAKEEGFGIINVYYKERIVANSLIWINEPYNCLVLDNIEVHPNYQRFCQEMTNCFIKAAGYLMNIHRLDFVVQGNNYNDLILSQGKSIYFNKLEPLMVKKMDFYTDARYSTIVESRISEHELDLRIAQHDNTNDVNMIEGEPAECWLPFNADRISDQSDEFFIQLFHLRIFSGQCFIDCKVLQFADHFIHLHAQGSAFFGFFFTCLISCYIDLVDDILHILQGQERRQCVSQRNDCSQSHSMPGINDHDIVGLQIDFSNEGILFFSSVVIEMHFNKFHHTLVPLSAYIFMERRKGINHSWIPPFRLSGLQKEYEELCSA